MANLLFVVHRYGYPGGSEYNVQRYAKACIELGHTVTVLAETHRGDQDGVVVTSDISFLHRPWDMIIVHGDGSMQNIVHSAQSDLGGPIMYLIIRPDPFLPILKTGMKKAKWIGCATSADMNFVNENGFQDKIHRVHYPIDCPVFQSTGFDMISTEAKYRDKFNITENSVYISCGGFWPHKGFDTLVSAFIEAKPKNTELVLTGYDIRHGSPEYTKFGKEAGVKIQSYFSNEVRDIYGLMSLAKLYIWNSKPGTEGYGLVLLESMFYELPWIGMDTAAAHDLKGIGGFAYQTKEELISYMLNPPTLTDHSGKDYVTKFNNPETAAKSLLSVIHG